MVLGKTVKGSVLYHCLKGEIPTSRLCPATLWTGGTFCFTQLGDDTNGIPLSALGSLHQSLQAFQFRNNTHCGSVEIRTEAKKQRRYSAVTLLLSCSCGRQCQNGQDSTINVLKIRSVGTAQAEYQQTLLHFPNGSALPVTDRMWIPRRLSERSSRKPSAREGVNRTLSRMLSR